MRKEEGEMAEKSERPNGLKRRNSFAFEAAMDLWNVAFHGCRN
jgi:hypothetical protein